jgi:hypothetical protein
VFLFYLFFLKKVLARFVEPMNDLLREATGLAGSKQKPHRRFVGGGAEAALAHLRAQVTPPHGANKGVYGLHLDAALPGFLVLSAVEAHRPAAPKQAKVRAPFLGTCALGRALWDAQREAQGLRC